MYFKELKDTLWVFDRYEYNHGLARVELIKVSKNTNEYTSAVSNSELHDETGKLKKIEKKKDDEEEKLYGWVFELREKYKKGIREEKAKNYW